jgi:Rrf2 family transcriptional regulator, iron-sulfur cluster assembly transcription factor
MKLSTKSRYGTRILLDLAVQDKNKPAQVSEISKRQGITVKYVEQILRPLKKEGYVYSVRGARGGYILAKNPKGITLGQIVKLFESQADIIECISQPGICDSSADCNVRLAWEKANQAFFESLDAITIDDIVFGKIKSTCCSYSIKTQP